MKCLLCKFDTNDKNELKSHYLKYHNVDEKNLFFKKLIDQKNNVIYGKKCKDCNEFVFSNKTTHDFLKHYDKGFFENEIDFSVDKPINITKIGDIQKYEITFKEHSSSYDFFDSLTLVEDFLNSVQSKMLRYSNGVVIRAGFSIENIQQALDNYTEPLSQTRYWSTEPINTKSLNDFVYFKVRESILKRVINNRLSGSAWSFHKFNYLNIKVLKLNYQLIGGCSNEY